MTMAVFPVAYPSGGQTIRGLGYGPRGGVPGPVRVILIHGYSSSKHALDPLASAIADAGYAAVSIDLPGHKLGATGATLISFETAVKAAADAVSQLSSSPPPVFIGHSLGAATAFVAASRTPSAAGAAGLGLGYPITVMRPNPAVLDYYLSRWSWVDGASPIELGLAMDAAVPDALGLLAGRPVLLVSGHDDIELPPSSALTLFNLAKAPKTHRQVPGDHSSIVLHAIPAVLEWLTTHWPHQR